MSIKVITFVKNTDFNTPIRVALVSNKQIHETVSRPNFFRDQYVDKHPLSPTTNKDIVKTDARELLI